MHRWDGHIHAECDAYAFGLRLTKCDAYALGLRLTECDAYALGFRLTDEHINTQGTHLFAAHFEVTRRPGDVARACRHLLLGAFHLQPGRLIG